MTQKDNIDVVEHSITRFGKELNICRRISCGILVYLFIAFVMLIIVFFLDIFQQFDKLSKWVSEYLRERDTTLYEYIRHIKCMLWKGQQDILNVILTLGTILAAAVIFFYSVQDNKKGGIPNRTIMAYTSGTFTVPVLFITVMVQLLFNQIAFDLGLDYFAWAGAIYTYCTQMWIIIIILRSTSRFYSIHAICNAEIRQYQKRIKLERVIWKMADSKDMKWNYSLLWTYLLQHMEQVLLGEELITDKLEVTRRLLRVPYYEKEIYIWQELRWLKGKQRKGQRGEQRLEDPYPWISLNCLKHNHPNSLYEFYYKNLITVLLRMSSQEYREERNKIYVILYEFIEELTELYDAVDKNNKTGSADGNTCHGCYTITISGIINAVMDSNVREAASFCNYVFNCLISKSVWQFQICLYILFQEYLYRCNKEAVKLDELNGIENFDTWRFEALSRPEREKCWEFWEIWTRHITLSPDSQREYLMNAILTLEKGMNNSVPISYVRDELRRRKNL